MNFDYDDDDKHKIYKISRLKYNYLLIYIISPYEFLNDFHVIMLDTNDIKMRVEKYESDKQKLLSKPNQTLYSYLYSFFFTN